MWRAITKEDPENFYQLQHQFIKATHYDITVGTLRDRYGFNLDNYSTALQNVVFSRSVQHGGEAAAGVIGIAISDLSNASEEKLITAIYKESGMWEGQPMKYFGGSSIDIQLSVWQRLNVDELNAAIKMIPVR